MATALISAFAASLIGAFCWRSWRSIGFAFAVPVFVGVQTCRSSAAAVTLAYFGAASWPLVRALASFASRSNVECASIVAWAVATILLSLPLIIAWTNNRAALAWRLPLALTVGVLPPLGLIGWASPLTSAGILFPGTAWFGLVATIIVPGLVLAGRPWIWIIVVVTCGLSHLFSKPAPPPSEWQTVHTSLAPGNRFVGANELLSSDLLQQSVRCSHAKVTVFPETVISQWTNATEAFWEPTLAHLEGEYQLAILGVGLPIPDSPDYENAALVIGGTQSAAFVQRIPVPVGMWRPVGVGPSVPLGLGRPGTMKIAGQRVAFLICYEQLLVLPVLLSAREQPTLLVGMANQYWIRGTSIPAAQRASLKAWSQLFALPLLIAENR